MNQLIVILEKLMEMKEVTVVGGSGLIGFELLKQLIESNNISKIHVLVRKEVTFSSPKISVHVVDFENEEQLKNSIHGEIIYCCIGTTKAKTPDVFNYEKIDRDIPVRLAQIGKLVGIQQFHLISAIGANTHSKINYNRIKGEAEEGVENSKIPTIFIYQPAMLIGKRSESRPLEWIAQKISPLVDLFMIGSLKKFHSVKAQNLAATLLKNSFNDTSISPKNVTYRSFEK
jgi:uncharacterized protein YbjT (DUF2867 family)